MFDSQRRSDPLGSPIKLIGVKVEAACTCYCNRKCRGCLKVGGQDLPRDSPTN
jgi:hypothetical protein